MFTVSNEVMEDKTQTYRDLWNYMSHIRVKTRLC